MVDKICLFLTHKIQEEMPEINNERAEIIDYGLHLIIGELPKNFIILGIAYILGIFKLTLLTVILLLPYRSVSGGFHLKTHLGCVIGTTLIYCGIAKISCYIIFYNQILPADTENVPILSQKERKNKKILSYIFLSIALIASCIIQNRIISNILLLSHIAQTICITKLAYKITKNKYGYEVYEM